MATAVKIRYFIVVRPNEQLRQVFAISRLTLDQVERGLRDALRGTPAGHFKVVDIPQNRIVPRLRHIPRRPIGRQPQPYQAQRPAVSRENQEAGGTLLTGGANALATAARVAIVLESPDHDEALGTARLLRQAFPDEFESGIDLPIASADHWCPAEATQPLFGDRDAATRLIKATSSRMNEPGDGPDEPLAVNMVLVDQGVKLTRVPNRIEFGGGWAVDGREPGAAVGNHGSMVMRNAIAAAARIRLYDFPLLPAAIGELQPFLSSAWAQYYTVLTAISALRDAENAAIAEAPDTEPVQASWVLVNAWGVLNRKDDPEGTHNYGHNPNHPLNLQIAHANQLGLDVVFAAGNCGQFCPSTRCGANDRGPSRSIYGANSHPDVLSVGAVRSDGIWLGYSSQGPGQPELSSDKPDVCATSHFGEVGDSSVTGSNSGTSAACGMASGVIAAVRNRIAATTMSPADVRTLLRETSRLPEAGTDAARRYGSGIVDAETALIGLV
jgi:hypothetical protein